MTVDPIPGLGERNAWRAAGTIALSISGVLLAAAGLGGRSVEVASAQESATTARPEAAPASGRSAAVALARLLPAGGLIAVGARPGVRVVELKVKEGDQVAAGAVLAHLEGHESAGRQLNLAEAQRKRADDAWAARLDAARQAARVSRDQLQKAAPLYREFVGTLKGRERYDAETAYAQLQLQSIKAELDLRLLGGSSAAETQAAGAEKAAPAARNPEEEILEAQVEMAATGLRETEVRAPAAGRVLRVLAHPGEVSPGTLLEMGDLSSMIARAEVYQSDVPRIRAGDPAEVEILGTRVGGRVTRIGSIVGKNQLTSVDPRALRDLRVVEVTIRLDDPAPAAPYVNMEVEATIRPSGAAPSSANGDARGSDRPAG